MCDDAAISSYMSRKRQDPCAKTKPILDEKELYHLAVISKNSGKTCDLLFDEVSTGSYKPNALTSGFISINPIIWVRSFENYLNPSVFVCQWYNYIDKSGKVFEIQIHIFDHTKKSVTIHIFLTTGVILIKGRDHIEWCKSHFRNLHRYYMNLLSDEIATMSSVSGPVFVPDLGSKANQSSILPNFSDSYSITSPAAPSAVDITVFDTPIPASLNLITAIPSPYLNSSDETPSADLSNRSNDNSLSLFSGSQTFRSTLTHTPNTSCDNSFKSSIVIQVSNNSRMSTDFGVVLDSNSMNICPSQNLNPRPISTTHLPESNTTSQTSSSILADQPYSFSSHPICNGSSFSTTPIYVTTSPQFPVFASIDNNINNINNNNINNQTNKNTMWSNLIPSPIVSISPCLSTNAMFSTPKVTSVFPGGTTSSNFPQLIFPQSAAQPSTPSNITSLPNEALSSSVETQLDALWQAARKNWTGLECIQTGISNITNQLGQIRSNVNSRIDEIKQSLSDIESKFDKKICAANSLLLETCHNDIRSSHDILRKELIREITGVSNAVACVKDDFAKELNAIKKTAIKRGIYKTTT